MSPAGFTRRCRPVKADWYRSRSLAVAVSALSGQKITVEVFMMKGRPPVLCIRTGKGMIAGDAGAGECTGACVFGTEASTGEESCAFEVLPKISNINNIETTIRIRLSGTGSSFRFIYLIFSVDFNLNNLLI
jgi:hypothetical protein